MPRDLFRTRIKFCGFTRPGDVRLASELGVDAIGLVFAHASRRRVRIDDARAIRNAMAPLVDVVALFSNNGIEEVREVVRQVRPTLLQFHGDEDDGFCRAFGLPYVKAIPMGSPVAVDARTLQTQYPGAAAFLFDSHAVDGVGGNGRTFDWSQLPTGLTRPFVLAGGMNADNVFDAIHTTLPWGVDVCSGIESEPGVKDGEKMLRFVEEVRRADCVELHEETGGVCDACG